MKFHFLFFGLSPIFDVGKDVAQAHVLIGQWNAVRWLWIQSISDNLMVETGKSSGKNCYTCTYDILEKYLIWLYSLCTCSLLEHWHHLSNVPENREEISAISPTSLIVASGNGEEGGREWRRALNHGKRGAGKGERGEGNCRGRPEKRTNDLVPPSLRHSSVPGQAGLDSLALTGERPWLTRPSRVCDVGEGRCAPAPSLDHWQKVPNWMRQCPLLYDPPEAKGLLFYRQNTLN